MEQQSCAGSCTLPLASRRMSGEMSETRRRRDDRGRRHGQLRSARACPFRRRNRRRYDAPRHLHRSGRNFTTHRSRALAESRLTPRAGLAACTIASYGWGRGHHGSSRAKGQLRERSRDTRGAGAIIAGASKGATKACARSGHWEPEESSLGYSVGAVNVRSRVTFGAGAITDSICTPLRV